MTKEIIKMFTVLAIIANIAFAISAFITKESLPSWAYAIDNLVMAYLFFTQIHTDHER